MIGDDEEGGAAGRRDDHGAREAGPPPEEVHEPELGQERGQLDQRHQDEVEVVVARHRHGVERQAVVNERVRHPGGESSRQ